MANSKELFVNPELIRNCAEKIKDYAARIKNTLEDLVVKMQSTEATYQAQSATEMGDKFNELKSILDNYYEYLINIANFLTQNVAEPAEVVDQIAVQNVASIHKPH